MNLNVFSQEPASSNELVRIFEMDAPIDRKKSIDEIQKDLDKDWIKTKGTGRNKLSYVSGAVVTRLLNKAFQYQWSFQVITKEVVPSLPKPYQIFDEKERKYRNVIVTPTGAIEYATNTTDPAYFLTHQQPPVVQVLGRLTIPGYGVREQWGAHVLVGGASEQESGFKSATTDAMKKCASMFGIALQIYDEVGKDIEFDTNVEQQAHQEEAMQMQLHAQQLKQHQLNEQQVAAQLAAQAQHQQQLTEQQQLTQQHQVIAEQQLMEQHQMIAQQQVQPVPMPSPPMPEVQGVPMPTPPMPEVPPVAMPSPQTVPLPAAPAPGNVDPTTLQPNIPGRLPTEENAAGVASLSWADVKPQVDEMKMHQKRLGIDSERELLVPYIRGFLGLDDAEITELSPENITDFVHFLSQQTAGNGMSA